MSINKRVARLGKLRKEGEDFWAAHKISFLGQPANLRGRANEGLAGKAGDVEYEREMGYLKAYYG